MEPPSTPPHGRPRTPPTPQHGPQHDDFVPYSPRRSSRKTLNSNPYSTTNTFANKLAASAQTPAKKPVFGLGYAPSDCFSSPPASPVNNTAEMHKQSLPPKTPRRVFDNSAAGNAFLDPSSSVRQPFMLPTPTKTPTMTPARKHNRAASLEESARVLRFQPDDPNDSMPTRQQSARANKFRRLDFDSDEIAGSSRNGNGTFQIYTESQARVPQRDQSNDNPFYRPRANTVPQTACPSPPLFRKKTTARIQEERDMDDAAARNEGMVYTFRGRKVFQRFTDADDNDTDSESDLREPGSSLSQRALKRSAGAAAQRPLTRSQIKPRLLFPPDSRPLDSFTDEEAETDIDVPVEEAPKSDSVKFSMPATPANAKINNIMSPPSKARAPRKCNASDVPVIEEESVAASGDAADLPTPARSSKKKQKHVNFADVQVYAEATPEPVPADDDEPVAASLPTPQRSSRKSKKVAANLTPVVEDESEYDLTPGPSSPGRRRTSSRSPFDQWPRTKGGVKREGELLASGNTKRTRSAAASATT